MRANIRDIEIVFSDSQKLHIDRVKKIIQSNYDLILSCLGEDKSIDISQDESNFNNTFYYIVNAVYNNDSNKQALSDKDFLSSLHTEALIRRKKYFNTTIVEQNPNISDEMLSSLIAYKYFESNGTFDDFVEYLKDRNNEEKIFQWLQDVSRWDTYNYLLNITSNLLKTDDDEFFKRMNYITSLWLARIIEHIKNNNTSIKEYQKISDEEFDTLFYEFLSYINAPDEWIKIYNNLKAKGLIIVEKENVNEHDNSMCFQDSDGIFKILISNGDNLRGFCNFVHEFIHYVSRQNGLSIEKMSISEFPSIFFEKIAAEFLEEKGYSSEIVNQILNDRDNSNYSLSTSILLPLFSDLIRYINHGKISKNDKMALYQNQIDSINRVRRKMLEILTNAGEKIKDPSAFEEIKADIEKDVDDDCDYMIDLFIKDGLLVINGYQYLLDSYLVEQVLSKRNDDNTIIQKMIDVTNNLGIINIKDILSLFDIENALEEESVKKLIKK